MISESEFDAKRWRQTEVWRRMKRKDSGQEREGDGREEIVFKRQ